MAIHLRPAFAAALLVTLTAHGADTAAPTVVDYTLDPTRSSLKFTFIQAGAANSGRFRKFTAALRFGDANLGRSRLDVTVDVGSLDTGDEERNGVLRGPELFDVEQFPQARFKAAKFTRLAAGRYEAAGKLTIRNVTREIRVPMTFRTSNEKGVAVGYITGRTTINRLDFGVGQGDWKSTSEVANEVTVTFGLRLTAAATATPPG